MLFLQLVKVSLGGGTTLSKFDVTTLELWGRDIKDKDSIIVNANDTPKTLKIKVKNCETYVATVSLDGQNYTGTGSLGLAEIAINDIPTEEKTLIIKLTSTGMKDFTKTLKVKKDVSNTQPKDFNVTTIKLWGRDIKDKDSIIVNATDTPKTLQVVVTNCTDYTVNAKLGEQNYTANATSNGISIAINDIPTEEKTLVIKLTGTGMKEFTKTLKVKKDLNNTQPKDFDAGTFKLWGHYVDQDQDKVTVYADDKEKELYVYASNCDEYLVTVVFNGKTYKANATSKKAKIEINDIPTEEKEMIIKLSAAGMKDYVKNIKVKKEFSKAYDLKVFFKTEDDNIEKKVLENEKPEFQTTKTQGEVIVKTKNSIMTKISVNGHNVTLSSDKKSATYELDTSSDVDVKVEVEFENFKKAERTFKVKKYANQNDIPFVCNKAKITYGNFYVALLNFNSENEASVELDKIEYSCVKLEMEMNKALTSATLMECKDDRSQQYSTAPTNEDMMGIFSGRLKVTDNPIKDNVFTEYLIVGYGTVEYKFEIKSNNDEVKNYTVRIKNKNKNKIEAKNFAYSHNYGKEILLSGSHVWKWSMYSKLPLNGGKDMDALEYMGDDVKMDFYKQSDEIRGEMYFYYRVYDDPSSKKHEFIRIGGRDINQTLYLTSVSINPEEKYVDAFVAFKYKLPQGLHPIQTKNKWKKIVNKGFLFRVENEVINGNVPSLNVYNDIFNYRVQAKNAQNGAVLNIGIKQKYKDAFSGSEKTVNDNGKTPFLGGGKFVQGEYPDFMVMTPTFSGKMEDNIESFKYTVKKNGAVVDSMQNVSLTPEKWTMGYFCLNAKDSDLNESGGLTFANLYAYEKGDAGNENIYEIEVKVTPKGGSEEVFNYKINYRGEESIDLMSLTNEPDMDSNLFGVPTSYAETVVNEEIYSILKKGNWAKFFEEKTN